MVETSNNATQVNTDDVRIGAISELAPPSNVLKYILADESWIAVRPSGTEPKIKFYFEARAQMKDMNDYERVQQDANARIDAIIKDLKLQ